jgi:hypothetical protein
LLAICLEFGVILGVELLPWIAESWSQNTEKKREILSTRSIGACVQACRTLGCNYP